MKKNELYDAISGIDEKYLERSEDFKGISAEFRKAKARRIGTFSSICGCTVIIALTFFLGGDNFINNKLPVESEITISDNTSVNTVTAIENNIESSIISDISQINSDTENDTVVSVLPEDSNKPENNASEAEENSKPEISEPAVSENKGNNDKNTDISIMTNVPDTENIETTFSKHGDSDSDGLPFINLADRSLDEWLADTDVVWDESDTKGNYTSGKNIPLGSTKISDALLDLMKNGDLKTVYAVKVDFSSCIDENDMLNWEYNGDTISGIYDYLSVCGTEDDTEFKNKITEIRNAYFEMKIQSFAETFGYNQLGIYMTESAAAESCFYTFAYSEYLLNFECNSSEAFIFCPADRIG